MSVQLALPPLAGHEQALHPSPAGQVAPAGQRPPPGRGQKTEASEVATPESPASPCGVTAAPHAPTQSAKPSAHIRFHPLFTARLSICSARGECDLVCQSHVGPRLAAHWPRVRSEVQRACRPRSTSHNQRGREGERRTAARLFRCALFKTATVTTARHESVSGGPRAGRAARAPARRRRGRGARRGLDRQPPSVHLGVLEVGSNGLGGDAVAEVDRHVQRVAVAGRDRLREALLLDAKDVSDGLRRRVDRRERRLRDGLPAVDQRVDDLTVDGITGVCAAKQEVARPQDRRDVRCGQALWERIGRSSGVSRARRRDRDEEQREQSTAHGRVRPG
jgi:hypothetical protein